MTRGGREKKGIREEVYCQGEASGLKSVREYALCHLLCPWEEHTWNPIHFGCYIIVMLWLTLISLHLSMFSTNKTSEWNFVRNLSITYTHITIMDYLTVDMVSSLPNSQ